ncbi:MAG TPA: condensation domain-containing protein, partial [Pseudonocardiaceae bacterium]|nr:condensation domain-containing protein [Pseudonocardiaceae bacterium]
IELGEVEAALARHPAVTGTAVTAREDRLGDTFLVAYYEPAGTDPTALRDFAATVLPRTAVPARFLPMAALPRTAGGKVDRRALPAPPDRDESAFVAPRTETERHVARIVAAALGVARIGLHDDFFRLGGHSLLAIRTASRLRTELAVDLPVRLLFEAPTVAHIAAAVDADEATGAVVIPPARPDRPPRASSGQQRLAFVDRLRPCRPEYLVTVAARLRGPLDVAALADALREVVTRHEPLRTRCVYQDGELVQLIDPPDAVRIVPATADGDVTEFVTRVSDAGFRLADEPPLRVTLAGIDDADHVLVLGMHHIACDARSIEIIMRELGELYARRPVPAPPVRFADFAEWERTWSTSAQAEAQLEFWRERLRGAVPLELPTDHPRTADRDTAGAAVEFTIPAALANAVTAIGRDEAATPFMTMLAAFTVLLAEHTGQDDIVLGTTVTGRPLAAVENLVGPFMNSVVLRTDVRGGRTFIDVLRRVRDSARAAFANQDIPFERVVDAVRPRRDPGRNPLFQVLFELEPHGGKGFRLDGVAVEPVLADRRVAKLDLMLHLDEQGDGSYAGSVQYATALFDEDTARGVVTGFLAVLEHACLDPAQPLAQRQPHPVTEPAAPPVEYLVAADVYEATVTQAEDVIADIWADVLELDRVGRKDNFFDLGGHSLSAIEVQARVQEEFDIDVPLRALFEAPVLSELAAVVEQSVHHENATASSAVHTEGG